MLALLRSLDRLRGLGHDGGSSRSDAITNGAVRKYQKILTKRMKASCAERRVGDSKVQQRRHSLHEGLTEMQSVLVCLAGFVESLWAVNEAASTTSA